MIDPATRRQVIDEVRAEVNRQIEEQRQELVEVSWAIQDAAEYGTGYVAYVWDHKKGRAVPRRVHPERIRIETLALGRPT